MKNLLIITQRVDENDDLLGFFVAWLKEFSKYFDKVFVITLAKGSCELPNNVFVHSLGKEKGSSKFLRIVRFYAYLFKLIPQSKGVFVHMSPIFAIASWPVAVLFGKKIFLWYLHRSLTFRLKVAEKLSYKILTAAKESLNIKSRKVIELGHGIDAERFKTKRSWENREVLKILNVGRISKIKDYETLIRAAKNLKDRGLIFEVKIVGQPVMPHDFEYFESLKKLVGDLGLEDFIEFVGFVPYSQIAGYYKESDIFVNLSPKGGIDKAVLEAMASGSLVLISNTAFRKYFDNYALFFECSNSVDLVDKIIFLNRLPSKNKKDISDFLVRSVSSHHRLGTVISRISALL